jgi:pyruvate dehydrogenase (quinone)
VASEYVQMAVSPAQVRHLVDRAMRIALDQRTVTCIIFPNDVQDLEAVKAPPRKHGTVHSGIGYTAAAGTPNTNELAHAGRRAQRRLAGGDARRRRERSTRPTR